MTSAPTQPTAALLQSATRGFDHLFSNDVASAKAHFTGKDDPFHLLGLGVCSFLEAALGMESGLMTEASRLLTLSEAGARRQAKIKPPPPALSSSSTSSSKTPTRQPRFPPGLEWEILAADAVVLLGLTHALSESYMGYFQCMYALNSAHSKFTKLYKTVYPHGLPASPVSSPSPRGSMSTLTSRLSIASRTSKDTTTTTTTTTTATATSTTMTATATLTPPHTVRTSLSTSNLSITSTSSSIITTTSAQTTKSHLPPPSVSVTPTPTRSSFFGNPPVAAGIPIKSSLSTGAGAGVGTGVGGAKTTGAGTPTRGFFSRWTGGGGGGRAVSLPQQQQQERMEEELAGELGKLVVGGEGGEGEGGGDGPVEELVLAGTAFGFGLFNLVFSLLPKKIQSLVGLFGFKHDRKLALRALGMAAETGDVHGVFAGLVLMTYHGVVLLLSGYQADEAHIVQQYRSIVDRVEKRYPEGALWILNRAKILRMSNDAAGAIRVLTDGLKPGRPHSFAQADTLLVFELAWTLLGEMRYQDAADMFIRITELNTWSHGTYYFLAAGCYSALGKHEKAQALYDAIPDLIDKKKIGGKDLPTEVLIKKKLLFYKEKQKRRGGDPALFEQAIKISTAEELGIFWNTHARVHKIIAEEHIKEWSALTPIHTLPSSKLANPKAKAPSSTTTSAAAVAEPSGPPDLDTPDELALRSLLLGICHRTTGDFASSRECLRDAYARHPAVKVSTWIGGVAMFELAVLDLKIVEHKERALTAGANANANSNNAMLANAAVLVGEWDRALAGAVEKLDIAIGLASAAVDLSSRLDSRIMMLRDEIAAKKEKLGIL